MAVSIDWAAKKISIPKADLTFISGTLYELDTNAFRLELKALEDNEDGITFVRTHIHNTEVTVAGITYARTVEIINGYTVEFEDGAYSVRLVGSNNNIWDIENGILVQNQVQVIPTNSGGLIVAGTGLDAGQDAKLTAINDELISIEGGYNHADLMRATISMLTGVLTGAETGASGTVETKDIENAKTRITIAFDSHGNRTSRTFNDLT